MKGEEQEKRNTESEQRYRKKEGTDDIMVDGVQN